MPPNTVKVDRSTDWGNPYRVSADCPNPVAAFRKLVMDDGPVGRAWRVNIRRHLKGKNLACWCPPERACHVDVYLEVLYGGDR